MPEQAGELAAPTKGTFAINEADYRDFFEKSGLHPVLMHALYQRFARGRPGLGLSEVIYACWMAKNAGLPPGGPWYDLIAKKALGTGQVEGFTCYFKKEAAEYILTHDDRVEGPIDYWWVSGDGEKHDKGNPPTFFNAKGDMVIDRELRCYLSVKLKSQEERIVTGDAYRNWATYTDSPERPWVKHGAHMLLKQVMRIFVQKFLGCQIEFTPEVETSIDDVLPTVRPTTEPRALPPTAEEAKPEPPKRRSRIRRAESVQPAESVDAIEATPAQATAVTAQVQPEPERPKTAEAAPVAKTPKDAKPLGSGPKEPVQTDLGL